MTAQSVIFGAVEIQDPRSPRNPLKINPDGSISISAVPPVVGAFVDHSASVITGSQSQTAIAANPLRKFFLIQNPKTATETLFIDFTEAASTAANGPSIGLEPGEKFQSTSAFTSTEVITVNAATSGHSYVAKEG